MINEADFIDFKCPHCGETASFPGADVGFVRTCPNCMEDLIVPEAGSEAGRKLPLPVNTARLNLRRLGPGDWKDLMDCVPGWEEESVLRWLEQDGHVRLNTPEQTFRLGIELQEGAKLIGYVGLRFTDAEHRQATLEATLNDQYAQDDVGVEAIDAFLGFCFEGIKLHRVTARCDGGNGPSRQLFEKVGMRREAECIKDRWVDEEWRNSIWYAALEEDYIAQ